MTRHIVTNPNRPSWVPPRTYSQGYEYNSLATTFLSAAFFLLVGLVLGVAAGGIADASGAPDALSWTLLFTVLLGFPIGWLTRIEVLPRVYKDLEFRYGPQARAYESFQRLTSTEQRDVLPAYNVLMGITPEHSSSSLVQAERVFNSTVVEVQKRTRLNTPVPESREPDFSDALNNLEAIRAGNKELESMIRGQNR